MQLFVNGLKLIAIVWPEHRNENYLNSEQHILVYKLYRPCVATVICGIKAKSTILS